MIVTASTSSRAPSVMPAVAVSTAGVAPVKWTLPVTSMREYFAASSVTGLLPATRVSSDRPLTVICWVIAAAAPCVNVSSMVRLAPVSSAVSTGITMVSAATSISCETSSTSTVTASIAPSVNAAVTAS